MTDIVCCLTPPGVSAIAVVGFRGPGVWRKLSPYFQPAKHPPRLGPEPSVSFGRLTRIDMGDEVVLVLQGDEREQFVEVQTHGGPGVVAWVLQLAEELGCHRVEWQEWLRRTDRTGSEGQAKLWGLLPRATTRKMASILLDQYHRAMERELGRIRTALVAPQPDHPSLLRDVQRLRRRESLGQHVLRPWKVVLAGAPNAGKSSLMNALLGFERAITSPTPGTTRDVVTATLVWDGYPFELIDTAGLRESGEALEAAGIELARQNLREADVVLWLVDLSQPRPALPEGELPTFLVGTKADLPHGYDGSCDFRVSAVTGEGLASLLDAVLRKVVPEELTPGEAVPVLEEHREELRRLEAVIVASNHS
jgi:tRNA modification GTPase